VGGVPVTVGVAVRVAVRVGVGVLVHVSGSFSTESAVASPLVKSISTLLSNTTEPLHTSPRSFVRVAVASSWSMSPLPLASSKKKNTTPVPMWMATVNWQVSLSTRLHDATPCSF
jgi:hypothetical protein